MTAYLPSLLGLLSGKPREALTSQQSGQPAMVLPFPPSSAFPAKEVMFKQVTPAVLRDLYMAEARKLDSMQVSARMAACGS